MSIPAFLLGLLPFVNLFRAFPIPGLWTELAALCAFGLCLLCCGGKIGLPTRIGPMQGCLLTLMLAIALRSGGGGSWGLICCLILLCCLVVHAAFALADSPEGNEQRSDFVEAWAAGVTVAFLLNMAASVLAWQELEWVLYTLVPSRSPERWGGTFGQPNQFGVFAGMAVAATLYLESRRKVSVWIAGLVVALAVMAIVVTGSRSALLIWVGIWLASRNLASSPGVSRALFHGQWGLMLLGQLIWLHQGGSADQPAAGVVSSVIARPSGTPRLEQWRDAWLLFVEHPVLGVGWGRFAEARFFTLSGSMAEPEAAHTHNLFSQLVVELGVLGWLVCGMLVWLSWHLFRQASRSRGEHFLPALIALALMAYSMFEYPFWSLSFLFTFVWLCALALPSNAMREMMSVAVVRILGVVMLACGLWLAADYAHFQKRLMQVWAVLGGGAPQAVSEMDVLDVRRRTFFVDAVDEYWIDTSHRLDGAGALKWPVVERLFSTTPTAGGGVQYVMYAVLAGKQEKAAAVLDRFRTSAPSYMFPMMMKVLRREARQDPALDAFLKEYGLARNGPSDASEPALGAQEKPGAR